MVSLVSLTIDWRSLKEFTFIKLGVLPFAAKGLLAIPLNSIISADLDTPIAMTSTPLLLKSFADCHV